jgi:hypothetical protein
MKKKFSEKKFTEKKFKSNYLCRCRSDFRNIPKLNSFENKFKKSKTNLQIKQCDHQQKNEYEQIHKLDTLLLKFPFRLMSPLKGQTIDSLKKFLQKWKKKEKFRSMVIFKKRKKKKKQAINPKEKKPLQQIHLSESLQLISNKNIQQKKNKKKNKK